MTFQLNHNDCKILESMAECRTLTPAQIAALHQKGKQAVWRRLRILEKEGLIGPIRHELGRGRGRPEILLGLTEHGVDIVDGDMAALARLYLRARRMHEEVAALREASERRRQRRAEAFLESW